MAKDDADKPQNLGFWDPNQALTNLTMEHALDNSMTPEQLARKLLKENLPVSVMAICHLATFSDSEVVRFNAAKYVVERTMGPAERAQTETGRHVWDDLYNEVTTEAERYVQS